MDTDTRRETDTDTRRQTQTQTHAQGIFFLYALSLSHRSRDRQTGIFFLSQRKINCLELVSQKEAEAGRQTDTGTETETVSETGTETGTDRDRYRPPSPPLTL